MINPEIINYIKQQVAGGTPREKISALLKQNSWNDADITEAFNSITGSAVPTVQPQHPITPITLKNFGIILFLLILFVGGGFFYWQSNRTSDDLSSNVVVLPLEQNNNVDDLSIKYIPVPVEENSASIFNSIDEKVISKEDNDFLIKYFSDYSATNTPSLVESRKILAKHKGILASFELGVGKKYYQCSLRIDVNCSLNVLRSISRLATLNSFVLFKDGKTIEAEQYAGKIVKLGQMVTEQADELINLLVGWTVQEQGYDLLSDIGNGLTLSTAEKTTLIKNLREEHKKVFRFMYTRWVEGVDYVTDETKKPSIIIDQDTEGIFTEARKVANNETWKPDVVKKWFYDSLLISLSNIDLPCGSEYLDSKIDVGFNPKDTSQTENFVGKMLYHQWVPSIEGAGEKRCEVEALINVI